MTGTRGWRWDRSPRAAGRPAKVWMPALAILGALLLYFWPFVSRGEHAVPFHFESPAVTGMAAGAAPRTLHQRFPDHDDSPVLIAYPNAVLAGKALRRGELPTWNPYVGCGAPAMAGGQVYPFSPFLWPFYLLPAPGVYTLALMAQLLWLAWGAYLWLGRLVPARAPRLFGALLCAFNPWTARLFIYSSMGAACWLGWILWSWDQALDRGSRRWWLPAVMIALSAYSGHPEVALLLAAASACYAVAAWAAGGDGRLPLLGFLGTLGGATLLGVLLAAAQWLPVLAGLPEAVAYKFQGAQANVTPGHYLFTNVFNPRSPVFINPALWGLLLLGSVAAAGARKLWPVLALAVVGLQLSFWTVGWDPLVRAQSVGGMLPGIYARGVVWFAAGALAAAGVDSLTARERGRWFPARILLIGVLAFAGLSWADYQRGAMIYLSLRRDLILFYAALGLLLMAGACLRPGLPRKLALGAALAGLLVAPLADEGFRYPYFNATQLGTGASPAVAALKAEGADPHARVAGYLSTGDSRPCFSPDLSTLWGIRDARLLDVLQNRRLWGLQDALGADRHRLLRTFVAFPGLPPEGWAALGVRYLATAEGSRDGTLRWESVPGARPRAFIVHRVTPAPNEPASERDVRRGAETADATSVVLEGWTGPARTGDASGQDGVSWEEDGLSLVRLRATAPTGGVLVLLDTYASGWHAEIDGRAVRILPADLAFRAVELPPGRHEVTFRYRPWSVPAGIALSLGGLLIVGVVLLLQKRGGHGA